MLACQAYPSHSWFSQRSEGMVCSSFIFHREQSYLRPFSLLGTFLKEVIPTLGVIVIPTLGVTLV